MWEWIDVKTLLRAGLMIIALGCAVLARLIAGVIGNDTLKIMATKAFIFFVMMALMRLFAGWFDYAMDFEVGVFSTIVTYAFNLYILFLLGKLYWNLKYPAPKIHLSDKTVVPNPKYINKPRLSENLDEMFAELKINIRRTRDVEKTLMNIHQS